MTLITHDACVFVCFTTPLSYCDVCGTYAFIDFREPCPSGAGDHLIFSKKRADRRRLRF